MENNRNKNKNQNYLELNNTDNLKEVEKEIDDGIEEGEYFYGNDYTQNFGNILGNKNAESNNQIIILNNNNSEINENNDKNNLEKTLNIICKINPDTIINLFEFDNKDILYKSLFKDKIGQIDFNSVIIREYLPDINQNIKFYNKYFQIISKVVYPTIQIFYGVLSNADENNKKIEIVLEYISSDFEEVQIFIKNCLSGDNINYLIINKINEVLSYIYECGYPYLMLYPSNIKFNNKLFKQYFQVNEDSSYLYTVNKNYFSDPSKIFSNNFMKITNVGTYLKYKYLIKNIYYSLKEEFLSDICFLSQELIKFIFDEKIEDFPQDINILEKWDIYSFGCLIFYIFYQKNPYFFIINDININNENKYKKLIDTIIYENNFLKTHLEYFDKNKIEFENQVSEEIINLINNCTNIKIENRPTFNEVFKSINNVIKSLKKNDSTMQANKNNSKDIFHDYSFYQLSNYNDDLIITKEILKNNKYKQELIDIKEEYQNSKKQFINFFKHN